MEDFRLQIPVSFMVFNRPDTTAEVFRRIRRAKPPKLYLVSDGARKDRPGEQEKVEECRRLVEEGIDWDCRLVRVYADENMGCKMRMATGITRVFEEEEMAIILEDDCVPEEAFFPFLQENLLRYREDPGVMLVSGTLNLPGFPMEHSYCFSRFASIWGWGSYRRAWALYDVHMSSWPEIREKRLLRKYFSMLEYQLFLRDAEGVYSGRVDTWDMQWLLTVLVNGTGIVPSANLIRNIGCGREDATHTKDRFREISTAGGLSFPLRHPDRPEENTAYDRAYCRSTYGLRRVLNKLKRG